MNKLSKPTRDSLVPLPIVSIPAAKRLESGFESLTELLQMSDGVLVGRITRNHLFRIERESGEEGYFTTLSLEGKSLSYPDTGQCVPLDLTYNAGSIRANRGVNNPNAPCTKDVEVGLRVVVFHRLMSDLGGGIRGNGLVGMQAGLFQTRSHLGRTWVQGKGSGSGIAEDLPLAELKSRIANIESAQFSDRSRA